MVLNHTGLVFIQCFMEKSLPTFEFHEKAGKVFVNNQTLELTHKAFQLLNLLVSHSDEVVSKEEMLKVVWAGRVVSDNTVHKTISRLRSQLIEVGVSLDSVFGEGYRLVYMNEISAAATEHDNKRRHRLMLLSLVIFFAVVFSVWIHRDKNQLIQKVKILDSNLETSKQAFISQVKRRNELGALMSTHLTLPDDWSWEKRFFHYFDEMTEQEQFICQQVRAYSEGPLYESNLNMYKLLIETPELIDVFPMAQKLKTHLSIWLNKHKKVFLTNHKMCLVYVGVEDGAPFPSELDQQVKDWLKSNGS